MALDAFTNLAVSTLTAGITSGATSFNVTAGQGARFAAGSFNATIWNATDYAEPDLDPNAEIVRSSVATDTFTITRGQEGTAAVAHNTGGKTYMVVAGLTALSANKLLDKTGDTMTGTLAVTGGSVSSNRRVAGGISGIQTTSVSLTASSPQTQIWNPGAGQTCTLPAASALNPGEGFDWVNFSANAMTVARAGADTITAVSTTGATSSSINAGARFGLRSDGVSIWYRIS